MGAGALRNEVCGCGSGLKVKDCPCANPTAFDRHTSGRTRPLSGAMCLHAASTLRSQLDYFNIRVPASADLAKMLRTVETLGDRHPGLFSEAPFAEEKLDLRYIDQVTKLAAVLASLRSANVSGKVDRHLSYFRKRLDRLETLDEKAQDYLLELEVGAALASAGVVVSFEEPDLVVSSGSILPKIALPCKRPRHAQGVDGAVRDGTHQARKCGLPSVILVCLDAVVNCGDDGKPLAFWSATLAGLHQGASKLFDDTIASIQPTIDNRTDPNVVGLIWLARVPGAVMPAAGGREQPSYSCPTLIKSSVNRRDWESRPGPLHRLHLDLLRGLP